MAKLSEEKINIIINLYKEKEYTKKKIAELAQCSVDSVNRILERNGLKEIKLSQKLLDISNNVVKDFLDGEYCKDIAKKYSVDEHSIYKILDKNKIKRQSGYHSKCIENYFEKIDNPHKAYLLGFITADGAIVNGILSIEVHQKDVEILEFAKSQINPKASLTPTRNCYKVTFGAKQLGRDLAKYGIIQNKSKLLERVPIDYIPKKLLSYYFRGLIDGDGCIHKDGRVCIYSGSKHFIEDVQRILVEEINISKLSIYEGTTFFIGWDSKKDKEKIFHYLYDNLEDTFYYKRKYNRLFENCNHADTEVNN